MFIFILNYKENFCTINPQQKQHQQRLHSQSSATRNVNMGQLLNRSNFVSTGSLVGPENRSNQIQLIKNSQSHQRMKRETNL
jgi:hypothetical protein